MQEPRKLISKRSIGVFQTDEWMKSGYGLLESSRTLRAVWTANKRQLKLEIRREHWTQLHLFAKDNHLLGPSMLLLGYAAEMFLKAALAKVLIGCSEDLFKNISSKTYSHNLQKLAQDVYFELDGHSTLGLSQLQTAITSDGRYPIEATDVNDHAFKRNSLRFRNSNRENYRNLCDLVRRLANHSQTLAGPRDRPVSVNSWQYDLDGYVTLWWKQGFRPRITYRLSGELMNEQYPVRSLREMVRAVPGLDRAWEDCDLFEETAGRRADLKRRGEMQ